MEEIWIEVIVRNICKWVLNFNYEALKLIWLFIHKNKVIWINYIKEYKIEPVEFC